LERLYSVRLFRERDAVLERALKRGIMMASSSSLQGVLCRGGFKQLLGLTRKQEADVVYEVTGWF
jgi:hypothetical protein